MIPLNMKKYRSPRISVVLPSRKRPEMLARSLQSLYDNLSSPQYRVEILIGYDSDDPQTLKTAQDSAFESVMGWMAPGRYGYGGIANYYAPLLNMSSGQWIFLWGDDAIMQTKGWDQIIRDQGPGVLYTRGNPDGHNCFPVVHSSIFEASGRFTGLPAVDTWYDEVGRWSGRWADPGITVLQDRPDLTGVAPDATYNEGRSGYRAAEYYNNYWTAMREQDSVAVFEKLGPEGARSPEDFILKPVTDTRLTMRKFGFTPLSNFGEMLKYPHDLVRYRTIIEEDKPEVIVETGTRTGASARWFKTLGVDVITIDIANTPEMIRQLASDGITAVTGSSIDADLVERVDRMVDGRRCMVSLDSDHTYRHVSNEISLYSELVSPGCHLVVEDGIFRYATPREWERWHFGDYKLGNPLDAIDHSYLPRQNYWERDVEVEAASPITHHVGGWWKRK